MNTQYFCSPELSDKLQKLGVESQFDFWCNNKNEIVLTNVPTLTEQQNNVEFIQAYHWSDLLLPDALKKVWGNIPYQKAMFLYMVECGGDWQSFLEQEVDKKLSEKV